MKRFLFPLRPVAMLRSHHQARAREAFAASVHVYVEAEKQLAGARARQLQLEALLHEGRRATFRAADEITFLGAYRQQCHEVAQAERTVSEARAAMAERREQYLEAHRAVKVVEKLEQKARTAYREVIEREAQLELDEMAGYRVAQRLAAATTVSG